MEDAHEPSNGSNNNLLRPLSTPAMASRFPSLRRLNSAEPFRHRSLPADSTSPGSNRNSSEITFAVLYDDGPNYHIGHYDDEGSIHSGRPGSAASYEPSFRTRDSRVFSDEHAIDANPDFVQNERLLTERYLNNNNETHPESQTRYPLNSDDTLMNDFHGQRTGRASHLTIHTGDRSGSKHSHESWCTCEDDQPPQEIERDIKEPARFQRDVEAQNGPPTPTPFLKDPKAKDAHLVSLLT